MNTKERTSVSAVVGGFAAILTAFILFAFHLDNVANENKQREWDEFCSAHAAVHTQDPDGADVCVKDGALVYQEGR